MVVRLLAVPLAAVALGGFHSSIAPLSPPERSDVARYWHAGCPVPLSGLRMLSVTYWGFDDRPHQGSLVVNAGAAPKLAKVFRKLYAMRFAIHHMSAEEVYGPPGSQPADGDLTGSFECRNAVASPCSKGTNTGHWSNHAYGLAVDINPVENPYVGCGMTRDKKALSYLDRSRVRKGMVTPAVVAAFASVGWGWGGSWTGATKDYMHFSYNGH